MSQSCSSISTNEIGSDPCAGICVSVFLARKPRLQTARQYADFLLPQQVCLVCDCTCDYINRTSGDFSARVGTITRQITGHQSMRGPPRGPGGRARLPHPPGCPCGSYHLSPLASFFLYTQYLLLSRETVVAYLFVFSECATGTRDRFILLSPFLNVRNTSRSSSYEKTESRMLPYVAHVISHSQQN